MAIVHFPKVMMSWRVCPILAMGIWYEHTAQQCALCVSITVLKLGSSFVSSQSRHVQGAGKD